MHEDRAVLAHFVVWSRPSGMAEVAVLSGVERMTQLGGLAANIAARPAILAP
jgi:hypothetical protein